MSGPARRGQGGAAGPASAEPGAGKGSAGRVIAGLARGIRLAAPGAATRPLADRVKEALFAILEPDLAEARVLDLFAGSGAAGIEALSRGAAGVVFVERDPGAVAAVRANLARTHLGGPAAVVVQADVLRWLAGASGPVAGPYDVAFVDPPYDRPELLREALATLARGRLLSARAVVVAKHFWKDAPPARVGLLGSVRERRFGETALTFFRPVGSGEEDG